MKKIVLFAAAVLAMFTSCQFTEENPNGSVIDFRANLGTYSVKATDTQFEQNDAVSITALDPIHSGNVKYTYKNGALTSENPICWNSGQQDRTRFLLLYPYNATLPALDPDKGIDFCVNADQSTHALYTASDLMVGDTWGSPSMKQVSFTVQHALSQIVINLDNKSDKQVTDAYFANVYGEVHFSYNNGIQPTGSKGTIKACPLNSSSQQSWVLVMAPQTSKPDLMLTTSEGKQITYTLPQDVTFRPGYRYTASVVLNETTVEVVISAEIQDWTPDIELNFQNEGSSASDSLIYLGAGTMVDDIIAELFGFQHEEFEVDYYTDQDGNIIIKDPYKNASFMDWTDIFGYVDGATITLAKRDDYNYYIKTGSSTGFLYNGSEIFIESYCYENGWTNEDNSRYFNLLYNGNYSSDVNSVVAYVGPNAYYTNTRAMTTFTLPGYIRYPVFYNFEPIHYNDSTSVIWTQTGMDITRAGIAWFPGPQSISMDLINSVIEGTAENMMWHDEDLTWDRSIGLNAPFTQTGVYTVLAAGDCFYKDGQQYYGYYYRYVPYLVPGDQAPECSVSLKRDLDDMDPTTVKLTVVGKDISQFWVLPIIKSTYDQWLQNNIDIEEMVEQTGKIYTGVATSCAANGKTVKVEGLQPETEYYLCVFAQNYFDNTTLAVGHITTGSELTFTSLGTGMFYDNFIEYSSSVEILQESSGKPVYRVMRPYAKLLQEKPDLGPNFYYTDEVTSDYIEFYTHEYDSVNYVFYKPFYNGLSYTGLGALRCEHTSGDIYDDPSLYFATYRNIQTAPGVFSLAPFIYVGDGGSGFECRDWLHALVVVLPGYEWNPEMDMDTKASSAAFSVSMRPSTLVSPKDAADKVLK